MCKVLKTAPGALLFAVLWGCLPALLPWDSPAPDPGLAMPAIPGGLRPFSLTYVWGGGATALQNRPTPARAHIVGEDGQLPALQHVFQLFVGRGPSGCGEEGLHAQGLGQPALRRWDGAGTRDTTLPWGPGPGAPPPRGRAWKEAWAGLGSLEGRRTH